MKQQKEKMSVDTAIDNLNTLVELSEEDKVSVEEHQLHLEPRDFADRAVEPIDSNEQTKQLHVIKETFKTVLGYLKQLHVEHSHDPEDDTRAVEGIKTIMVLVGEAAEKLNRFTAVFQGIHGEDGLSTLKEYQQLQAFYRKQIADENEEEKELSEWFLSLEEAVSLGHEGGKVLERGEVEEALHDLSRVKRDTEYEFFFLKKEDGERFFDRKALRDIRLECDFGEDHDLVGEFSEDPLIYIKNWQDKDCQIAAKNILTQVKEDLDTFYKEAMRYKEMEFASKLIQASMALMLAANPKNLLRKVSAKSCYSYFCDFQNFLRLILESSDYKKMLAYPPGKSKKFLQHLLKLTHSLCKAVYTHVQAKQELTGMIKQLIEEGSKGVKKEDSWVFPQHLTANYNALVNLLSRHPSGPLFKVLDLLMEGDIPAFDSLLQDNLPHELYNVFMGEKKLSMLRMGSPTRQVHVDKALVNHEFKGFLRACAQENSEKTHLIFNLQDRTSWKEHARCLALEDLQLQAEFCQQLKVVTMATDTDFYHQAADYRGLDLAEDFIEQFRDHIRSEGTGFFFPGSLKEAELFDFVDEALTSIHTGIFSGKKSLARRNRLIFIDIMYLLLQAKVVEILQPDTVSMTCKDAIDTGSLQGVLFYIFLRMMGSKALTKEEELHMNAMLFVPSLLIRERCVHPERFSRFINLLSTFYSSSLSTKQGVFNAKVKHLFEGLLAKSTMEAELKIPTVEENF